MAQFLHFIIFYHHKNKTHETIDVIHLPEKCIPFYYVLYDAGCHLRAGQHRRRIVFQHENDDYYNDILVYAAMDLGSGRGIVTGTYRSTQARKQFQHNRKNNCDQG
jgi:hypothetical protein